MPKKTEGEQITSLYAYEEHPFKKLIKSILKILHLKRCI